MCSLVQRKEEKRTEVCFSSSACVTEPWLSSREMTLGHMNWPWSQRAREMRALLAEKGAALGAVFWILCLISSGSLLGLCPVTPPHSSVCPLPTLFPRALLCPPTLPLPILLAKTRQNSPQTPLMSTMASLWSCCLSERHHAPLLHQKKVHLPPLAGLEVGADSLSLNPTRRPFFFFSIPQDFPPQGQRKRKITPAVAIGSQ